MMKKLLSVVLAFAMVFGISMVAGAATVYSVVVNGENISFVSGGKTVGTYVTKTTDLKLKYDDSGDLLMCFYDNKGSYKGVNLSTQASVTVSGTMDSLTISSNIKDNVSVKLPAKSSVTKLTVENTGTVYVYGSVDTLNLKGGAKVNVYEGAEIETAKITSKSATLVAATGSSVNSVQTVAGAKVSGNGIVKKKSSTTSSARRDTDSGGSRASTPGSKWDNDFDDENSDGIRVKLEKDRSYIEASSGDRLKDLTDELYDCFSAYVDDNDEDEDGRSVNGDFVWTDGSSREVEDGKVYSFRFIPNDNSKYRSVRGSIQIYVR